MNDISSYNELFLTTAKEHVEAILKVLHNDNDNQNLNEVFRRAHSLKGSSEMMNHEQITSICDQIISLIRPEDMVISVDNTTYDKLRILADELKKQLSMIPTEGINN